MCIITMIDASRRNLFFCHSRRRQFKHYRRASLRIHPRAEPASITADDFRREIQVKARIYPLLDFAAGAGADEYADAVILSDRPDVNVCRHRRCFSGIQFGMEQEAQQHLLDLTGIYQNRRQIGLKILRHQNVSGFVYSGSRLKNILND